MNRKQALNYVSFYVNDALSDEQPRDLPRNARLIGWQCGFEPLFVAVYSYLPNTRIDDESAIELATDLLAERKWFSGEAPEPEYVL